MAGARRGRRRKEGRKERNPAGLSGDAPDCRPLQPLRNERDARRGTESADGGEGDEDGGVVGPKFEGENPLRVQTRRRTQTEGGGGSEIERSEKERRVNDCGEEGTGRRHVVDVSVADTFLNDWENEFKGRDERVGRKTR